jgi:hypothetical protein
MEWYAAGYRVEFLNFVKNFQESIPFQLKTGINTHVDNKIKIDI